MADKEEPQEPKPSLADAIPPPTVVIDFLTALPGLPGHVAGLVGDLPEMITSQFDHEMGE